MSTITPPDLPGVWHRNGERFTLSAPLTYASHDGYIIRVPAGYPTDFASVPRVFWSIFPRTGRYQYAAVIHDWLYDTHHVDRHVMSRAWCDRIFYEAMRDTGVGARTRWTLYLAVRLGGGSTWAARNTPPDLPPDRPFLES